MDNICQHIEDAKDDIQPKTPNGCEECLKTKSDWIHLRLCLECGHVGCCDSSLHKHATVHFHQTRHPVMKSFEEGENWRWCYVDEIYYEPNLIRSAPLSEESHRYQVP